jgi:hypothetical protein
MSDIYAVVENGTVVNLIVWDGNAEEWQPPASSTCVPVPAGTPVNIGDTYDGAAFSQGTSSM